MAQTLNPDCRRCESVTTLTDSEHSAVLDPHSESQFKAFPIQSKIEADNSPSERPIANWIAHNFKRGEQAATQFVSLELSYDRNRRHCKLSDKGLDHAILFAAKNLAFDTKPKSYLPQRRNATACSVRSAECFVDASGTWTIPTDSLLPPNSTGCLPRTSGMAYHDSPGDTREQAVCRCGQAPLK